MNNNIKGFDLPMGLFASKIVVDISGKESNSSTRCSLPRCHREQANGQVNKAVDKEESRAANSAGLSNLRGRCKGGKTPLFSIKTKARD